MLVEPDSEVSKFEVSRATSCDELEARDSRICTVYAFMNCPSLSFSLLRPRLRIQTTARRITLIQNARRRMFTVLALESSADDTCAAVVTSERQILSNVVINQQQLYALLNVLYTSLHC